MLEQVGRGLSRIQCPHPLRSVKFRVMQIIKTSVSNYIENRGWKGVKA